MRLAEILTRLEALTPVTGNPRLCEVSRVQAFVPGARPLPGTVYLVEEAAVLWGWLKAHQGTSLLRHLAFVLPQGERPKAGRALRSDLVFLSYPGPRLPLDLGAQILTAMYEAERPVHVDADQLRREVVEDALQGDYRSREALLARGDALGLDLGKKNRVLVADLEDPEVFYLTHLQRGEGYLNALRGRVLLVVREVLLADAPHHVVVPHGTGFVVLFDRRGSRAPEALSRSLLEALRRQVKEASFVAGLGCEHPPPEGLAKGYGEAQAAIEVHRIYGLKRALVSFAEVRPLIFLHALARHRDLLGLLEPLLAPLRSIEPRYRRALLETLVAYFEHDRSASKAAKALGIHPNTFKYRMRRLEALLGLREVDSEHKLLYHIAAKTLLKKPRLSP